MRTVLAIDPGTATTGYAVISLKKKSDPPALLDYGCITTSAKLELPERLVIIAKDLQSLIAKYKPTELAVERLYFAKNVSTGIAVGQARGVVLLTGAKKKLKIAEYNPVEIKQAVTGYGQADKQQIQPVEQPLYQQVCPAFSYVLSSLLILIPAHVS